MRVLGIDFGTRRIGLALSDAEATFAFPLDVLERHGAKRDLAALTRLVREREVERIVVGHPLHMDGRRGPEAEAAERFAQALSERSGVQVDMIDERWTTVEAERSLRELGHKPAKRKQQIDAVAASILLSTYLERLAHARAEPIERGAPGGASRDEERGT